MHMFNGYTWYNICSPLFLDIRVSTFCTSLEYLTTHVWQDIAILESNKYVASVEYGKKC